MATTKRDLVRLIAKSPIAVTQKLVNQVLNAFFDTVIDVLAQDGRLELRGFGTFFVVELPAHTGRNPMTGEPVTVPAQKHVRFKMSKKLREAINA